ncbi:MAG: 50S ribosomal protein L3 [marine benthic group bacterium]|jgi:large subunit ribosomal protein L3|nr:50S ribosomal protein L3 [Candidatus Benthicola marisminoris]
MPGLIGKKLGMTQIFTEDGRAVGCTVLEVGPCPVVQIKTEASDGYEAIQLGFGAQRERRVAKPEAGHAARAGLDHAPRVLAEFEPESDQEYEAGQSLTVDLFEVGQKVKITGLTKGRGFQGTVKRHGFGGSRASHGGSATLRKPGSIGPGTDPSRVIKGRKMSGQMGGTQRTAMNRRIEMIDAEKNLMLVRGSVPGSRHNVVLIRSA